MMIFKESCRSHFIGAIRHDESQEKLRIPMGLTKYMKKGKEGLSGKALILRGPSGQCWKVKLSLEADGLFLTKGWGDFLKGNDLHEKGILFFSNRGGKTMSFDVRMFGANGLERFVVSGSGKEKVCVQLENDTSQGAKDAHLSYDDLQPEASSHKRKMDGPAESSVAAVDLDAHMSYDDLQPEASSHKRKMDAPASIHKRKMDAPAESSVAAVDLVRDAFNQGVQSPWFRSHAFSSSNPFFRCIIDERSAKHRLQIPKVVCPKNIFPGEKTKVILRNSNMQFWVVKVEPSVKSYTFTTGWHKFVQENDLKEECVCVFELIQMNELLVHVFY